MEVIAQRVFSPLYIALDSIFVVVLCILLFVNKKYLTLIFALCGGILYMVVDYGIFHLLLGTRSIEGGSLFWVLLWMSMSYGITNFALIWIWLSKDKLIKEFTLLIWVWWICCPMITSTFANTQLMITIQRTTGSYHGFMALIMLISYVALMVHNMRHAKDRDKQFNILWLFAIGIMVQLGWEAGLLIGGIRSAEFDTYTKVMTLITNSLVETNLGIPAIYLIYLKVTKSFQEDLTRVNTPSLMQRLKESNSQRIFG